MGIFDFFKPKKQKENKEIFDKIKEQVFPGGVNQINKEITEVRKLVNFRYTYEEVKMTYLHATAMFYVADDRSEERIINSILYNEKSCFTKLDAQTLYIYLLDKFGLKKTPSEALEEQKEEDDEAKMIAIAIEGIVYLEKYKSLSNEGKFEVVLFNSLTILKYYQNNYPKKYNSFQANYFINVMQLSKLFGLDFEQKELEELANNKIIFYSNELKKISLEDNYMPSKLYSCFYINPLSSNPSHHNNPTEVMSFYSNFVEMINWVDEEVIKV